MPVDLWTRHPPEVVQDIVKRSVEGVLTEELPELVATLGNDIGQNLRDNQSHSLALQRRENRAQRPAAVKSTSSTAEASIQNQRNGGFALLTRCMISNTPWC